MGTLQNELAEIAANALSSKKGSKQLLSGAMKASSADKRPFKRFASVLSMQVEAYPFATDQQKVQIASNIARLQEAIEKNPKLNADKGISDLMARLSN